jgi:hypothetical protein
VTNSASEKERNVSQKERNPRSDKQDRRVALEAMPVVRRIVAVADDVKSRRDRYFSSDLPNLLAAAETCVGNAE